MADEFCLKMPDFHVMFSDLLHAVNLRHGTNGFTSLPKEGVLKCFFRPEKSDGFGRLRTRELGVPKASTLTLDHRSSLVSLHFPHLVTNYWWTLCMVCVCWYLVIYTDSLCSLKKTNIFASYSLTDQLIQCGTRDSFRGPKRLEREADNLSFFWSGRAACADRQ